MNFEGKNTGGAGLGFLLLLMLACGLLLGGCESDSVTPDDELPQLTEKDAVQQSALVAAGISRVGPRLVGYDGSKPRDKDLGVYEYEFPPGGDVSGSIILEYFSGGSGGTPCAWGDADFGHLFTLPSFPVTLSLDLGGGVEPVVELTFDIEGEINQDTDTAVVNGSGTFTSGEYVAGFTFTDLVVTALSSYPTGGMMGFTAGALDLTVIFDGGNTANVVIDEIVSYVINLDTGNVAEVD